MWRQHILFFFIQIDSSHFNPLFEHLKLVSAPKALRCRKAFDTQEPKKEETLFFCHSAALPIHQPPVLSPRSPFSRALPTVCTLQHPQQKLYALAIPFAGLSQHGWCAGLTLTYTLWTFVRVHYGRPEGSLAAQNWSHMTTLDGKWETEDGALVQQLNPCDMWRNSWFAVAGRHLGVREKCVRYNRNPALYNIFKNLNELKRRRQTEKGDERMANGSCCDEELGLDPDSGRTPDVCRCLCECGGRGTLP